MPIRIFTVRLSRPAIFLVDVYHHQRSRRGYMRLLKPQKVLMSPGYRTSHTSQLQRASTSRLIPAVRQSLMPGQTNLDTEQLSARCTDSYTGIDFLPHLSVMYIKFHVAAT